MRAWTVPDPLGADDESNPVIEGRLRRFDCSQMTDGGAGTLNIGVSTATTVSFIVCGV